MLKIGNGVRLSDGIARQMIEAEIENLRDCNEAEARSVQWLSLHVSRLGRKCPN